MNDPNNQYCGQQLPYPNQMPGFGGQPSGGYRPSGPGGYPYSQSDDCPYAQPGGYPYPQPVGYPYHQPGGYPYPQPGGYPYPQSGGYPYPPPEGYPPGGYTQPDGYRSANQTGFVPAMPHGVPPDNTGDYGPAYDPDNPEVKVFQFTDKIIRNAFIRKVYSIFMCQLLIVLGVIALFMYHIPTQKIIHNHPEMFWVAFGVMLVTMISMVCCTNVRRTAPMNYIFLTIFTMAEAFLLGIISVRFRSEEVIMAVGITAATCLALTLFAFQTKWDITVMGGVLFVAVIVLMIFGIVAIFVPGKTITLIYASLGALLFSIYLIYDTQMMMGGKHKYSISPEEYTFAALTLYLDIAQIFRYILAIFGITRGGEGNNKPKVIVNLFRENNITSKC